MGVRDRDDILDNITFFRLAEVTNVLGEQGVSEAQLILIHLNEVTTVEEIHGGIEEAE